MSFFKSGNQKKLKKFRNTVLRHKSEITYDQLLEEFSVSNIKEVTDFLDLHMDAEEYLFYDFDNQRRVLTIDQSRNSAYQEAKESVKWIKTKKVLNRDLYYISQLSILILSALTTLAIGIEGGDKTWQLILSISVTFCSAVLVTFKFKDNWIRYSGAINKFEAETSNFALGIGKYANKDKKEALEIFNRKIQDIKAEETEEWKRGMTTESIPEKNS